MREDEDTDAEAALDAALSVILDAPKNVLVDRGGRFDIEPGHDGEFFDSPDDATPMITGGETQPGQIETSFEDDSEALHRRLDEASIGPNGEPLDGLARAVNFRNIQQAADKEVARPVNINPETVFRAMLGREQTVQPGQAPQEVVRWVGRDVETCPVSVTFGPTLGTLLLASPAGVLRPFMRLQFGTRGGVHEVDIDVGTGGQLTIPASVVYVSVGLDAGSTVPFRLTASIGFFPVNRPSFLTRTAYIDALAAAATATVNRPNRAAAFFFDREEPANQFTLRFRDSTGVLIATRIVAAGTYVTTPIQLSNDCATVTITNDGAVPSEARAIFVLNL